MICEVHTSLIRIDPNNNNNIDTNQIQSNINTPIKISNTNINNDIHVNEDLTMEVEIIFEKLKGCLTGKNISLLDIQLKEGINEKTIRNIVSKRQDEIEIIVQKNQQS